MDNFMTVRFKAVSENEGFARTAAAAFLTGLDPLVSEIEDIKAAVSEAVTNAIIHGYDGKDGEVEIRCKTNGRMVYIEVEDEGVGIENIEKAREPMFTTKPSEERSGLGFTVMESFMDEILVESEKGKGTTVKMIKLLNEAIV